MERKRKKGILLVSRYGNQRKLYEIGLTDAGYSVRVADNGDIATKKLLNAYPGSIDLVIMGSELLAGADELKSAIVFMGKRKKVHPVIIHTSSPRGMESYKGTPLEAYIKKYMIKDSNPDVLVKAVRELIGPA